MSHSQKGVSDGLETDNNGAAYAVNNEGNAINIFNPVKGTTLVFVRDPRINGLDTSKYRGSHFIRCRDFMIANERSGGSVSGGRRLLVFHRQPAQPRFVYVSRH